MLGAVPSKDEAFSIGGSQSSEQQRLIQLGQLTPFGGRVDEENGGNDETVQMMADSQVSSLHIPSSESGSVASAKSVLLPTGSEQSEQSNVQEGQGGSNKGQTSLGQIQLSSDSFDGLFSDLPVVPRKKTSGVRSSKGKEKAGSATVRKRSRTPDDRERLKTPDSHEVSQGTQQLAHDSGVERDSVECISSSPSMFGGSDFLPEFGRVSNGEREGSVCSDEYVPDRTDLEEAEESGESEYYTDEELGEVGGGSGWGRRRKRRRRLRELSSGESEDEMVEVNWSRRKRSSAARLRRYQDDGDEELYRMRIR